MRHLIRDEKSSGHNHVMARLHEHMMRYAEYLDVDYFDKWIVDYASKGTKDDPIHMSYGNHLVEVHSFIKYSMTDFLMTATALFREKRSRCASRQFG